MDEERLKAIEEKLNTLVNITNVASKVALKVVKDVANYTKMSADVGNMLTAITEIKDRLDKHYVTKDEFDPVKTAYVSKAEFDPIKRIVYGSVSVILITVLGAIIALVVVARK